jgi:predicted porin
MKKLVIGLLMAAVSALAFADNVIIERAWTNGLNGGKDSDGVLMKYGKTLNKNLETDFQYQTVQTEGTNAMSTRLEVGLIPSYDLGFAKLYARATVGEKYNTTGNFTYMGIEPGVIVPLGNGFSTRVGYRYRDAVDSAKFADRTNTWRVGVKYDFNKQDAVNLRVDRVRGDQTQNIVALSYIRSF